MSASRKVSAYKSRCRGATRRRRGSIRRESRQTFTLRLPLPEGKAVRRSSWTRTLMTLGDDLRSGNYARKLHNSVVWLIRCLERRRFIRRIPASPRAIEVLRLPHEAAVRTAA